MASDLFTIGRSGVRAAKAALDLTAQNIANVHTEGYQRRSLGVSELSGNGSIHNSSQVRLAGVLVDGIERGANQFLHTEARRTGSEAARSAAQLEGLRSAERAVESSGLFSALTEFEASLAQLASDPLSTPLRGAALESARVAASAFNLSAKGLAGTTEQVQTAASADVASFNTLASELARINANLPRTSEGSSAQVGLLDQRDKLLGEMATIAGIAAQIDDFGRAEVRLGSPSGPTIVAGDAAASLSVSYDADGRGSFTLASQPVSPTAGRLAGHAAALDRIADLSAELDTLTEGLIDRANTAQASGVTPAGAAGQPLFSGAGASDIAVSLASGAGLATAPAGSPTNSRDSTNLASLRSALAADDGPSAATNRLLYALSSEISSRALTGEALTAIAVSAVAALAEETAVDLDREAADLIRFQQAFQANGRVIQSAREILDTILALG